MVIAARPDLPDSFLRREERGAERGAGVAGDRLHVDVIEGAALFERANQQDVQENAAGDAERDRAGLRLEAVGQLEHGFFEEQSGRCAPTPR